MRSRRWNPGIVIRIPIGKDTLGDEDQGGDQEGSDEFISGIGAKRETETYGSLEIVLFQNDFDSSLMAIFQQSTDAKGDYFVISLSSLKERGMIRFGIWDL